jgi:hypothetical protein
MPRQPLVTRNVILRVALTPQERKELDAYAEKLCLDTASMARMELMRVVRGGSKPSSDTGLPAAKPGGS